MRGAFRFRTGRRGSGPQGLGKAPRSSSIETTGTARRCSARGGVLLGLALGAAACAPASGREARAPVVVTPGGGIEPPASGAAEVEAFGDDARPQHVLVAGSASPRTAGAAHAPRRAEQATAHGSAVAAGTSFTVRLNDSLGTAVSQPGDDFSAVVLTPLYTKDGQVLVPRGALLFGRVSDVRHSPNTGLYLQLLTIETTGRPTSLQATVRRAGADASVDSVETYQPTLGYDAVVRPPRNDNAAALLAPGPRPQPRPMVALPAALGAGIGSRIEGGRIAAAVGGGPPSPARAPSDPASPGGPAAAADDPASGVQSSSERLFLPEGSELLIELAGPLDAPR